VVHNSKTIKIVYTLRCAFILLILHSGHLGFYVVTRFWPFILIFLHVENFLGLFIPKIYIHIQPIAKTVEFLSSGERVFIVQGVYEQKTDSKYRIL